jgi:ubiquinol-cytochrome c reductase cytochrome c1 subunit
MKLLRILALGLASIAFATTAAAGGDAKHAHAPEEGWPFEGPTGKFDQASLQRGYQVYKEVCSSCHSMKLLSYRNLGDKGGPFYDPDYPNPNDNPYVKALAAENEILDPIPNEFGDFDYRPAIPADPFRSPYPNDAVARAANMGALPPDLSVITKARHAGASYVYSLMTGYPAQEAQEWVEASPRRTIPASDGGTPDDPSDDTEAQTIPAVYETRIYMSRLKGSHGDEGDAGDKPKDETYIIQPDGQYYNPYMAGDTTPNYVGDPREAPYGGFLAMPPQLMEGRMEYLGEDAPAATPEQMAKDVAQFLAWAGEPHQEKRKSLGMAVMIYLFILAILMWFSYKAIWRNVEH